jgi:hypothetical protein
VATLTDQLFSFLALLAILLSILLLCAMIAEGIQRLQRRSAPRGQMASRTLSLPPWRQR